MGTCGQDVISENKFVTDVAVPELTHLRSLGTFGQDVISENNFCSRTSPCLNSPAFGASHTVCSVAAAQRSVRMPDQLGRLLLRHAVVAGGALVLPLVAAVVD